MSMGRPAAAYPDQDHVAHIKIHLAYANDPNYGGSPLIGPMFAPKALEHIKQHLTLHYLQSMRSYVAQAAGGEDTLKLNEERPLTPEDQKALALAAQMVSQDAQQTFQAELPAIQGLLQKVQQAQQNAMQNAMMADPAAQALLKTQTAETQRKVQEFQAKMQQDTAKQQQEFDLRVAELQRQVAELVTKYETQSEIDSQRNSTNIATANINNASRERIAAMQVGAQMDGMQAQLQQEQIMSAIDAINAADDDIRKHGIAVEQERFQRQADMVQSRIQAQRDAALQQQQAQLDQQNALEQQMMQAAQPQQQPPTGEV